MTRKQKKAKAKAKAKKKLFFLLKSSWLRILLCSKKRKPKLKSKFRNQQEKEEKVEEVKKEKEEEVISPLVEKYWVQRYDLFSKYDNGIKMDEEGWYSVTPEQVAAKQAERCRGKVVIDCFSGVAGNSIQFAGLRL